MHAFEACVSILCDELNLHKRQDCTNRDQKVLACKIKNSQSNITKLVVLLNQNNGSSYDFIC